MNHRLLPFLLLVGQLWLSQPKVLVQSVAEAASSPDRLFNEDEVLSFTLSCDLRKVVSDRGEKAQYHEATLVYKNADSSAVSIALKTKVRGNFRRNQTNCLFPPLLLNFSKGNPSNDLFSGQNKLKLVTHCQGDQYVIREYLVYKLFNRITDRSFRARLVKVTYADTQHKRKSETHYGILLEDAEQLAKRCRHQLLKKKFVTMERTDRKEFTKLLLFEYMIGNVDWSVPYLHNIKLLAADSTQAPVAVPYDFDHSGIVNAPYALPPR